MILSNLIFGDLQRRVALYATAELCVTIEFHMAHDGSNLSEISLSEALK